MASLLKVDVHLLHHHHGPPIIPAFPAQVKKAVFLAASSGANDGRIPRQTLLWPTTDAFASCNLFCIFAKMYLQNAVPIETDLSNDTQIADKTSKMAP